MTRGASEERPRVVGRLVETSLRLVGIWPGCRHAVLHRLVLMASVAIAQIFQYSYVLARLDSGDLSDLVDSMSTTFSYTLVLLKLVIMWLKRGAFSEILSAMENDWRECAFTDWQMRIVTSSADLSSRFSKLMISFYWVSTTFYFSGVVAQRREKPLLIKMQLPFDSGESPTYELVILAQYLQQLLLVTAESATNVLLVTLILHAGCRIDIIRRGLAELAGEDGESCVDSLRELVGRHREIIAFSESIEGLYSPIALVQFLSTVVIMCLLGFAIVILLDSGEGAMAFVKFLPYYAGMNVGAFAMCFSGEYLSNKCQSVGDAAYEALWYDLRPGTSRAFLMLIMMSQRRLTITVGKFTDLSFECFATILKASVSYMSVLHAMY